MIKVKDQHNASVEFGIKTITLYNHSKNYSIKFGHVQVGGCSCAKQLLYNTIITKYTLIFKL